MLDILFLILSPGKQSRCRIRTDDLIPRGLDMSPLSLLPPSSYSKYVLWSFCLSFRCCNSYIFYWNFYIFKSVLTRHFLTCSQINPLKSIEFKDIPWTYSSFLLYLHKRRKQDMYITVINAYTQNISEMIV